MKVKTSEAERQVLNYLVAQCQGVEIVCVKNGQATFIDHTDGGALNEMPINYSNDWTLGGPIIEREKIGIVPDDGDANIWIGSVYEPEWRFNRTGPTPLIAAMRCYVSSKLGDEVEIPAELCV